MTKDIFQRIKSEQMFSTKTLSLLWLLVILKGNKMILLTLLYQALIAEGRIIEEGDIAVTDDSTPLSGNTMNAYLVDKEKLWTYGRVFYRFEKYEEEDGTFVPWFSKDDESMIREAMRQIHQQVPCITFRFEKNNPSVFYFFFVT